MMPLHAVFITCIPTVNSDLVFALQSHAATSTFAKAIVSVFTLVFSFAWDAAWDDARDDPGPAATSMQMLSEHHMDMR
jgi:hypothetical protein